MSPMPKVMASEKPVGVVPPLVAVHGRGNTPHTSISLNSNGPTGLRLPPNFPRGGPIRQPSVQASRVVYQAPASRAYRKLVAFLQEFRSEKIKKPEKLCR